MPRWSSRRRPRFYGYIIKGASLDDIKRKVYYLRSNWDDIVSHLRAITSTVYEPPILYQNEYAPLIATICDQMVRADDAWNFPEWLDEKIGRLTLENVLNLGEEKLRELMDEYLRGRWPEGMSDSNKKWYLDKIPKYIINSLQYLKNRNATPITIFENREYSATEVYFVLRQFDGIGPKKAAMIARDFIYASTGLIKRHPWFSQIKSRNPNFKVTQYIILPIDVHVVKVFSRLFDFKKAINWGKAQQDPSLIQDVIAFSIMVFPEQPSMLDEIFWNVGRIYCDEHQPKCSECPLREICGYPQNSEKIR